MMASQYAATERSTRMNATELIEYIRTAEKKTPAKV